MELISKIKLVRRSDDPYRDEQCLTELLAQGWKIIGESSKGWTLVKEFIKSNPTN